MSMHDREKLKLLQRVRRLRGQLDAVERLVNTDEDCGGQLMLLAAVRGGSEQPDGRDHGDAYSLPSRRRRQGTDRARTRRGPH